MWPQDGDFKVDANVVPDAGLLIKLSDSILTTDRAQGVEARDGGLKQLPDGTATAVAGWQFPPGVNWQRSS